jgi:hypothetical protein
LELDALSLGSGIECTLARAEAHLFVEKNVEDPDIEFTDSSISEMG